VVALDGGLERQLERILGIDHRTILRW